MSRIRPCDVMIYLHTTGGCRLRVAVEADGPSHFTANTHRPLGAFRYRQRCLEARGWLLVSVPHYEWYPLPQSGGRRSVDGVISIGVPGVAA